MAKLTEAQKVAVDWYAGRQLDEAIATSGPDKVLGRKSYTAVRKTMFFSMVRFPDQITLAEAAYAKRNDARETVGALVLGDEGGRGR